MGAREERIIKRSVLTLSMVFISVDGGATKTFSVLYDDNGNIISIGVRGSSNYRNVGVEEASRSIWESITEAIDHSEYSLKDVDFYTFALAGVKDSDISTSIIDGFISKYGIKGKYELLNDGEAGFRSRFPDSDGIIVAPGTGMIAYGKYGNLFERCSGWGWFIGDEGGAFYIGRRAIQESAKMADGRSAFPDNMLLQAILDKFNVQDPRRLVNEIYKDKMDIRGIASLATLVWENSKKGDEAAISILKESAREAATCAIALKKKFKGANIPVSGYGGVYRSGEIYWNTFVSEITKRYPDTEFKKPLLGYHAVLGSMQIVMEKHGILIDGKKIDELAKILDRKVSELPSDESSKYLMMRH